MKTTTSKAMSTPPYKKKLVRDLKVGDKLAPDLFDLLPGSSDVEITGIGPYGSSNHSSTLRGRYEYKLKLYEIRPAVVDKLCVVEVTNI